MLKSAEIEIKKEHQVLMVNKTTNFKKQGKSKGKFKKGGKKAATPHVKPKNGPKPDAECYYCKENGHWKRNSSKYLADLKSGLVKKKKEGEEETSSPRFISTRASEKLAKIFSDMSFESSADSDISDDSNSFDSFNFIDRSTTIGKVFTNLYDGVTKPNMVQYPKYHQIYAIGDPSRPQEETSENFDEAGNPYVDPPDLTRGLGTKYIGPGTREMVRFPQEVWDRVARAINGTEPMTVTTTPEELQAYQYRLARTRRELEKQ
ncbi:hypothetical protein QYE76_035061 [Lolium multiflorum]|uniref:Uncharacterized protein n=1 Tax=Lolium multiflorum TaxID=4521 RepID=A0AAD8VNV1_LOLMU|nr:hypothetical protein QYE76_035061 [Lolium multiflorum]